MCNTFTLVHLKQSPPPPLPKSFTTFILEEVALSKLLTTTKKMPAMLLFKYFSPNLFLLPLFLPLGLSFLAKGSLVSVSHQLLRKQMYAGIKSVKTGGGGVVGQNKRNSCQPILFWGSQWYYFEEMNILTIPKVFIMLERCHTNPTKTWVVCGNSPGMWVNMRYILSLV